MKLITASRKNAKMKMALQGPSGAGKTYSALLIGFGLCGNWEKIAVVDTENHSASLYDHLGNYKVLNLNAPFEPEKYCEAIRLCEESGIEVVILDSVTHCWEYLLDYHANLPGNSFTAWAKVTPRHNLFIQTILQSSLHIIATVRTKQDYVLVEKNNKQVPEKVGLKGIQRDGLEYDFTLVFDIDIRNFATASKDRTGLFFGKPEQKLSSATGIQIREWCNSGSDVGLEDVAVKIEECASLEELYTLYRAYPKFSNQLMIQFQNRKKTLLDQNIKQLANLKTSSNGTI